MVPPCFSRAQISLHLPHSQCQAPAPPLAPGLNHETLEKQGQIVIPHPMTRQIWLPLLPVRPSREQQLGPEEGKSSLGETPLFPPRAGSQVLPFCAHEKVCKDSLRASSRHLILASTSSGVSSFLRPKQRFSEGGPLSISPASPASIW